MSKMHYDQKLLLAELKMICMICCLLVDARCENVRGIDVIAAVRVCVEQLAAKEVLEQLGEKRLKKITVMCSNQFRM